MNRKFLRDVVTLHPHLILPPYDEIFNMDGFDAICKFSQAFSGSNVYVPSLRSIFKDCIEQEIRNSFNGRNISTMAKNFSFSERHIRKMVSQIASREAS